jgi:hypothetical protein
MWRFLLLVVVSCAAQAQELPQVKAPKPEPAKSTPVQVWDSERGFISLDEAVRVAPGRLVLEQVPSVRDRVAQADGFRVIADRMAELNAHRAAINELNERLLVNRYRALNVQRYRWGD